jgi:uncharacterized RDD family membrane protein YckC
MPRRRTSLTQGPTESIFRGERGPVSQPNPFEPPRSDFGPNEVIAFDKAPGELASRWSRFLAAMIDSLVILVVMLPLQLAFGIYEGFPNMKPLDYPGQVLWGAAGFVVWLVLHGYFLSTSAQTVGKKFLRIKIVDEHGENATLTRSAFIRQMPIALASAAVPVVGSALALIDVLYIFAKDRRCVHDHIAGTRVVNV